MNTHKILIVDDDSDTLAVLRNHILASGNNYILYQALKGNVAIRIAEKELPDLIITDWEMPEMNGIELIKLLKKNPKTSNIPAIMCTGVMTSSENLSTALEAGAVDFVRKPIDRFELAARIKSMLELSDSKKELEIKYELITRKNTFISRLIESYPYPLVFYGEKGIIEGYNTSFLDFASSKGTEVIKLQTSIYSCFPDYSLHQGKDHEVLETKKNISYEILLDEKHYMLSKNCYNDPDTKSNGILCSYTDITPIKEAHERILEIKKREITSYAIRVVNLTEMKGTLVENLKKALYLEDDKKDEILKQMLSSLTVDSKSVWNEFETHFNAVFDDFYTNLDRTYPDLSTNERKLCAFLKLNLSTKEIAALTFQNPKSVDMARYRLRKKMNLGAGENILNILKSI